MHSTFTSKRFGNEWIYLEYIGTSVPGEGIGKKLMKKFLDYCKDKPIGLEVEEGTKTTSQLIL